MMAMVFDRKIYEDFLKNDIHALVELMEMYIQQEDFTHPGFYALLKLMDPPYLLLRGITRMGERLKVPGCHPTYYATITRIIRERLYPFMVAYHKGLATEGQAVFAGEERDRRTKIIKTKDWRSKVQGLIKRDEGKLPESEGAADNGITTDIE